MSPNRDENDARMSTGRTVAGVPEWSKGQDLRRVLEKHAAKVLCRGQPRQLYRAQRGSAQMSTGWTVVILWLSAFERPNRSPCIAPVHWRRKKGAFGSPELKR